MKKVLIFLLYLFTSLFCCFIIGIIIDKRVDSIDKKVESIEKDEVNSNEMYEKLVIEEVVEIYGSDAYGYIIEEFECKGANEDIKYICLVKFYDGETYVERIMYVRESGLVYTEEILEEIEIS